MNILLFLIVFLIAIDQFALLKLLYRPMIACSLIGAVLGNFTQGLILGAMMELFYIIFENNGNGFVIESNNFTLACVMASILVLQGDDATTAVQDTIMIGLLGSFINLILIGIFSLFVPLARKAAEKVSGSQIFVWNIVPLVLRGIVFGACAVVISQMGTDAITAVTQFMTDYRWIYNGLAVFAMLLPSIGFAVLLRNISMDKNVGALLGGVAAGSVLMMTGSQAAALLLAGFMAIALFTFEYQKHSDVPSAKNEVKSTTTTNTVKGGGTKWW